MEGERKFVGRMKDIEPEEVLKREKLKFHHDKVFGLDRMYIGSLFAVQNFFDSFNNEKLAWERRRESLLDAIRAISELPDAVEHHLAQAKQYEVPDAFSDILPRAQALEDILKAMRKKAKELEGLSDSSSNENEIQKRMTEISNLRNVATIMIKQSDMVRVAEGSLSHVLEDGNVVPVGWEPVKKERDTLKGVSKGAKNFLP
ncbi:MAG: hypothetical protein Q7S01_06095 [bacterium]|nr:hypothetical protein [bacterium]